MGSIQVSNPSRPVSVSRPGTTQGIVLAVGPQGPPGPAGGTFSFEQKEPASTWTISHGMNRKPAVSLILSENPNEPVYTDITYPDNDTVVVVWPQPESGWAYL